jgi:glycogen synthase
MRPSPGTPAHARAHMPTQPPQVRFDFFSKAALEFMIRTGRQPDIVHCHDWSTAHVAKAYWEDYNP